MGNKSSTSSKARKDAKYGLVSDAGGNSDVGLNLHNGSCEDAEFVFHSLQKCLAKDDVMELMDFVEETGAVKVDRQQLLLNTLLCEHAWYTGKKVAESIVVPNQQQHGVNALNPELFVIISKKKYKEKKRLDKLVQKVQALQDTFEKDRAAAAARGDEDSDDQYDDMSGQTGIPQTNLEYCRILPDSTESSQVVRKPRGEIPLQKRYAPVQGVRVNASYPLGVLLARSRELTVCTVQCFAILCILGAQLSCPSIPVEQTNQTIIPPAYQISRYNNQVWLLLMYLTVLKTEYPTEYQQQQQMLLSTTVDPVKLDILLTSYNLLPIAASSPSSTLLQTHTPACRLVNLPGEVACILRNIIQYVYIAPYVDVTDNKHTHCIVWKDQDMNTLYAQFQRFNDTRGEYLHLLYVFAIRGLSNNTVIPNLALLLDKAWIIHLFPELETIQWTFEPMEAEQMFTILLLLRVLSLQKSNVDVSIYTLRELVPPDVQTQCSTVKQACLYYFIQYGLDVTEDTPVTHIPDWDMNHLIQAEYDSMLNPEELDPMRLEVNLMLQSHTKHRTLTNFITNEFTFTSLADQHWVTGIHAKNALLDEEPIENNDTTHQTQNTTQHTSYYHDASSDEDANPQTQAPQIDSVQELINQIKAQEKE